MSIYCQSFWGSEEEVREHSCGCLHEGGRYGGVAYLG